MTRFKSVDHARVNLAPLSVIVGSNSSGKSTLLQPILAIHQAVASGGSAETSLLNGSLLELGRFSEVRNFRIDDYGVPDWFDDIRICFQIIGQEQIPIDWRITVSPHDADDLSAQVNQSAMTVAMPGDHYFDDGHYYIARTGNQTTIVFLRDDPTISPRDLPPLSSDDFIKIFRFIVDSQYYGEELYLDSEHSVDRDREMEARQLSFQVDDRIGFGSPEVIKDAAAELGRVCVQPEFVAEDPLLCVTVEQDAMWDAEAEETRKWSVDEITRVNQTIHDIFESKVSYLGPLRATPRKMGHADLVSGRTHLGERGENTAATLHARKGDTICVPLPDGRETRMPLGEATNQWLKWFGIADSAAAQSARRAVGLSVTPPGADTSVDLASVGVGVSQVLPVILLCLLSEPADVLILEQPELHLHPALQKRMADFLLTFVCAGRQILVETHSDHLVNQLRTQVASDDTDEIQNLVKLIFAEQKDGITTYRDSDINEYGGLSEDWPDGFLDISARSAQDLVRQSLRKLKARS
ncbi:MAG: DUF3696 domain-containing protein [Acidimicrobiia bacterium]|nr:DUF3696 domain-containing protein [Acidimicrobiia bacterium]